VTSLEVCLQFERNYSFFWAKLLIFWAKLLIFLGKITHLWGQNYSFLGAKLLNFWAKDKTHFGRTECTFSFVLHVCLIFVWELIFLCVEKNAFISIIRTLTDLHLTDRSFLFHTRLFTFWEPVRRENGVPVENLLAIVSSDTNYSLPLNVHFLCSLYVWALFIFSLYFGLHWIFGTEQF